MPHPARKHHEYSELPLAANYKLSGEATAKYIGKTSGAIGLVLTGITILDAQENVDKLVSYGMQRDEANTLVYSKLASETAIGVTGGMLGGKAANSGKKIITALGAFGGAQATSALNEKLKLSIKASLEAAKQKRIAKITEPSNTVK